MSYGCRFCFGVSSFFAANLVNNIPMSVLYSSVIGGMGSGSLTTAALFSAVKLVAVFVGVENIFFPI